MLVAFLINNKTNIFTRTTGLQQEDSPDRHISNYDCNRRIVQTMPPGKNKDKNKKCGQILKALPLGDLNTQISLCCSNNSRQSLLLVDRGVYNYVIQNFSIVFQKSPSTIIDLE